MELVAVLVVGIALGVFYFGGLWATVRRLRRVRKPGRLLGLSFVLRTGVVLAVFAFLAAHRWWWTAVAVAGFFLAREVTVRLLKPALDEPK